MTSLPELLRRWHAGDPEALGEIVRREVPWIADLVHRRLGPLVRARAETQDIVQHTLVEVLKVGPRFVVADHDHLRALLARMVENVLRWHARHGQQQKRDVRQEAHPGTLAGMPAATDSVLILSPAAEGPGPATAAGAAETRDWVRLALELLDPDDRDVIVFREYDGLSFADVAQRLGLSEAHARVRFQRALPKLGARLRQLQQGRLGEALGPD